MYMSKEYIILKHVTKFQRIWASRSSVVRDRTLYPVHFRRLRKSCGGAGGLGLLPI